MGTDLRTQKRVTKLRMADMNERDAKLVQYLSEAFGKERELETALEAHIAMNTKAAYKKRLKQHLKETKGHAKQLQRRIKQLAEARRRPSPSSARSRRPRRARCTPSAAAASRRRC